MGRWELLWLGGSYRGVFWGRTGAGIGFMGRVCLVVMWAMAVVVVVSCGHREGVDRLLLIVCWGIGVAEHLGWLSVEGVVRGVDYANRLLGRPLVNMIDPWLAGGDHLCQLVNMVKDPDSNIVVVGVVDLMSHWGSRLIPRRGRREWVSLVALWWW